MAKEDIKKTSVITPLGAFEFVWMSFELRNSGSSFQRFTDDIFRDLDFVCSLTIAWL